MIQQGSTPRASSVQQTAPQQAQLDALRSQRSALTDQLMSLTVRRDLTGQQLARATGTAANELRAQVQEIDAQVKATNADLARIDEAVRKIATTGTDAPGISASDISEIVSRAVDDAVGRRSTTQARLDQMQRNVVRVTGIGAVTILLGFVFLWRWARSSRRPPSQLSSEDSMRLDQLQRAVDVIAIEVERISESQRFMAKTVAEEKRIP